ncbi:PREDICTED: chymotrypsin-1-like isoform X2 [Ceratosolen solmsi marchali]|uniref:Chymotrypsin-1-like isoform X2 n=1 Tax=Ceratosolen solmsi marchali TaxID=326594 RepID=A0AAJ6YUI2_9HYME|nr:PREDICTED: chymotrypsin-1-like isoform X2 [Ceratosolen solmsi marchali]
MFNTSGALARNVRIIGGHSASVRTYPFMAFFKCINDDKIFCGGSIISNKHILTAAQCVNVGMDYYSQIKVYTGMVSELFPGNVHDIDHVFTHPGFTAERTPDKVFTHDIAVVKLKGLIELNEIQNVIELPARDVADNDKGFILGWGTISHPFHSFPTQMQKAKMTVIAQEECASFLKFKLHDAQFCADNRQGIGPCMGDSGGPLVIDGKIAGIISVSVPCALGEPDIFIRTHYYIDFIRHMMNH